MPSGGDNLRKFSVLVVVQTDGKAARNLLKLQLFRQFYVTVIVYMYFTRCGPCTVAASLYANVAFLDHQRLDGLLLVSFKQARLTLRHVQYGSAGEHGNMNGKAVKQATECSAELEELVQKARAGYSAGSLRTCWRPRCHTSTHGARQPQPS